MRVGSVCAVLLACASAVSAQQSEPFEWSTMSHGGALRVTNVRGDVSIVPARGNRVEVRALKTWRRGNPALVRILADVVNGEVVVCVASASGTCASPRLDSRVGDVAVQFSIAVPAGMRLSASTVNGAVSVAAAARTIEASSTNGNVVVQATSGRLVAATVNGSVMLYLGELAHAVVDIEALALTSDVPLRVVGRVLRSRMRVRLGDGGNRRWELRALRGSVRVRQGPAPANRLREDSGLRELLKRS